MNRVVNAAAWGAFGLLTYAIAKNELRIAYLQGRIDANLEMIKRMNATQEKVQEMRRKGRK